MVTVTGQSGFSSQKEGEFSFIFTSKTAVEPKHAPTAWVPATFSFGTEATGARRWPFASSYCSTFEPLAVEATLNLKNEPLLLLFKTG
jgi:hypothetical protein